MNTFIRRTLLVLLILLPLFTCLFFAAPLIVDSYILPALFITTGPIEKHVSLTRITPFSVQGFLRFEENSTPVMSAPYIQVGFSPGQLLKKHFSTIRLDHATFHLHKINGKYRFKGFPEPEHREGSQSANVSQLLLPLMADRLILKECSLLLHQDRKLLKRVSLSADLDLNFTTDKKQYRLKSLEGTFSLSDIITALGSIDVSFENNHIEAELETEADRLPVAALELPESLLIESGKLKAAIHCRLNLEKISLEQLEARVNISNLHIAKRDTPNADLRIQKDIVISISGTPDNLEYRIGPVAAVSPVPAEFEVSGTGTFTNSGISTEGKLEFHALSKKPLITPPLVIRSTFQASFSKKHGLEAEIDAGSNRETKISTDTAHAILSPFHVLANFRVKETFNSSISADTPHIVLEVKDEEVRIAGGAFSASMAGGKDRTGVALEASFSQISLPSKELMLKNINLKIPVVYPFTADPEEKKGTVAIDGVYLKNAPFAGLSGTISQVNDSWNFSGTVGSEYLEGPGLSFSGNANPLQKTASLDWNMDQADVSSELLPPFVKVPENIGFRSRLSAQGALFLKKNGLSGNAAVLLEDGVIDIDGDKGHINGINCSVEMTRLPEIVSSPSQRCSAESLTFGNMHFNDLETRFRIDGPDTIFIEKSRAGWCRGMLESTSLSLSLADKKIDTVVYCSRINFADLLNQFGLDQAAGEGSVNGKLPVHFSGSGVRFDDGFLFSTPGTGGIVKFSNTEMLRQGVGSVDAGGYLEYSMAAMEDFSYNWTKLSFNSAGEELLLTMELDGKPRTPLPYKFKEGKIINTPEGDGMQYPIRLDVNFRLPLDDLFRVGQNINTIRENM